MRKLFQEFYYWAYKWMVKADCGGAEGFFAILWLTITQYFILIGCLSTMDRLVGCDSIHWIMHYAPKISCLGKYGGILNLLPITLLFYWVDYKIIMYKTDRKKIIRYYVSLPKKRRKLGLIVFWIYWALAMFASPIVAAIMKEMPLT